MHRRLRIVLFWSAVGLAGACGAGGGGGDDATSGAGLTVSLTDAASDDIAVFQVDIASLFLTRQQGGVVSVLDQPVTVDIAALTDFSMVLNVLNVPPGLYRSATISLDFSNACCVLVGQTQKAEIVDSDGNALDGLLTMPIDLGRSHVNLVRGRHRVLEFDFDLDQSVTSDLSANRVQMEPTFVLRLDPSNPRQLITGGVLVSVDTASETFLMELRTPSGNYIADLVVEVDDQTLYQVDGFAGQGDTGLQLLEDLPAGTWVQAYGTVHRGMRRIDASYVEAGIGTYNGGTDIVEGHVIGRVEGATTTLSVLGHSNNAAHTQFQFNHEFSVEAGTGSQVLLRGFVQQGSSDDLNIGQQIRVFGTLVGDTLDATSSDSLIRLQPTRVLGFANDAIASGTLDLDLVRVDLRQADLFSWNQGGSSPVDPDAVVAAVGDLGDGLDIAAGTAVEAFGFFSAVNDDGADFTTYALVNRDLAPSLLVIVDLDGGFTVMPSFTESGIGFDLSGTRGTGEAALIDRGFVGVQDLPTVPQPTVHPGEGFSLYSIRDEVTGDVLVYTEFAEFSSALQQLLDGGAQLVRFAAVGQYFAVLNAMTAPLAAALVQ